MDGGWRQGTRKVALLVLLLGLVWGCGGEPTAAQTPKAALDAAARRMSSLTSLRFTLEHEKGRTPLTAGVEALRADGAVALPNKASIEVGAVVTALGAFIPLKILVDGAQASMTDPLSGKPQPLPAASLPFNFLNLGVTLADIARSVRDPVYTSGQVLEGVKSRGIAGSVRGLELSTLIPSAVPDTSVALEIWVGTDNLIRRIRIQGPVAATDQPEVVRVLTLTAFDEPVTITLPQ